MIRYRERHTLRIFIQGACAEKNDEIMSNIPTIPGLERRREDYGLITGRAHYVDDVRLPERPAPLLMAVVRSPYAHATIDALRLEEVRALPGVVAAFSGAELANDLPPLEVVPMPGLKKPERHPLAVGKARYVGDPVAVILAEDRYSAEDALLLAEVDYTPLPVVVDVEKALAPEAPLLYDEFGTNEAFVSHLRAGDIDAVFQKANRTTTLRLVNQRIAPGSLEPRVCLFDYDAQSGRLSAWLSSQSIYRARETLARYLDIERKRVHVHNAEVGGGFGAKNAFLGEELVAARLAMRLGRPIKWLETRSENLQAQSHARGQLNYIEAAFMNDGRLLGLKVRSFADLGAFLAQITAMIPSRTPSMLIGPYHIEAVESEVIGVYTNKVPTTAYRGAGRPEATYILERTIEQVARELDLDPAEVRRRNFIPPDAFPLTTVTGLDYDSGNYALALDRLLELADYKGWRQQQRARRETGDAHLLGIGISTFTEASGGSVVFRGMPQESATVRIRANGTILVMSGVSHNGQGHFTAFAQIAAGVLAVPAGQVEVRMNDTDLPAFSVGTFGSRITQSGASAVLLAAEAVREKALHVAGRILEASPADLVLENGQVMVQGVPSRAVALGELACLVEDQPELIEHEQPNPVNGVAIEGLAAWRDFSPSGTAFASGAHLAVVEVDATTGAVQVLSYVAVDDCGKVLNHYLVEAQIHGSLAQGIGQALYEEVIYDEEGQLHTGTLLDYTLPIATQVPDFVTDLVETPSPTNPLGAKGVGESGCIGAPPTIVNAVLDALAPLGMKTIDMPLKPEKVWASIRNTRQANFSVST